MRNIKYFQSPAAQPLVFAEHQRVRLCREVECEGYRLCCDMVGTVLSVYGDGAAYAVEFAQVNGEIAVVTVPAEALVEGDAQ